MPLPIAARIMPIAQFLDTSEFDPETKRVMAVAFEWLAQLSSLATKAFCGKESSKGLSSLQKPASLIPMSCVRLC